MNALEASDTLLYKDYENTLDSVGIDPTSKSGSYTQRTGLGREYDCHVWLISLNQLVPLVENHHKVDPAKKRMLDIVKSIPTRYTLTSSEGYSQVEVQDALYDAAKLLVSHGVKSGVCGWYRDLDQQLKGCRRTSRNETAAQSKVSEPVTPPQQVQKEESFDALTPELQSLMNGFADDFMSIQGELIESSQSLGTSEHLFSPDSERPSVTVDDYKSKIVIPGLKSGGTIQRAYERPFGEIKNKRESTTVRYTYATSDETAASELYKRLVISLKSLLPAKWIADEYCCKGDAYVQKFLAKSLRFAQQIEVIHLKSYSKYDRNTPHKIHLVLSDNGSE
jgi:hypothetical protein